MPTVLVAHDYVCPWCWIGRRQAARLREEFSTLSFEWRGFELLPEGMKYKPHTLDPDDDRKPRTPTRLELLEYADGTFTPKRKAKLSNSRLALEGAEFARENGAEEDYHDAVYHAYWREDRDISDRAILTEIAEAVGLDIGAFALAMEQRLYRDRIVEFDEPAHEAGVWNVPTFMFPDHWSAEQPYVVLRDLARDFMRGVKP